MKIDDLSYVTSSDHKRIFDGVNLEVKPGEKVLLMAPSGWGKQRCCAFFWDQKDLKMGRFCLMAKM